jgi:membrane-associated protein
MRWLTDVEALIRWGGLTGIVTIVFIETGLFIGFFLPGDSLLVTAGIMAAAGYLDLRWLIPLTILAAIIGDQVNYAIGYRAGVALMSRYERFRPHLERAHAFYEKHGAKTIVLARFVPIVRTFAPRRRWRRPHELPNFRHLQHRRRHHLGFEHDLDRLLSGARHPPH